MQEKSRTAYNRYRRVGVVTMFRKGHYQLTTKATDEKKQKNGWNAYPRPQMKRDGYLMLNDGWTLNGHMIQMPFPPQSDLSEYGQEVGDHLTYEKEFVLPDSFTKERILLHFGAVDQVAEVWLNGNRVGKHEGGYLAFSFDITAFVKKGNTGERNQLIVRVTDTLSKKYPYGKQRKKRGGMWYTPVSGIWQSVWLENVPETYVEKIVVKPDLKGIHLKLQMKKEEEQPASKRADSSKDVTGFQVTVPLHNGEVLKQSFSGENAEVYLDLSGHVCADGSSYEPKLWSCEEPYLYTMKIRTPFEEVETYFGLRTIAIRKIDGINRVCLNGSPIFMHGILDQGYFCDGIYLPAEMQEYERDVLRMKELGFNMLREHIKVEPECFYYYCDKHGMLVMQDMVNNGNYSFLWDTALPTIGIKKRKDTCGFWNERKQIFREQMEQTIKQLYSHPCIVAYTIFNEGWGQFNSDQMYEEMRMLDDSRLIDATSGWFWQKKSDFDSEHIYFRTIDLKVLERPLLVSECGGYSRMIEGHFYNKYKSYGYGSAGTEEELTEMITDMYHKMILPGIPKGVCGCVYTQLSDVEDEVNGLYTYDRKVCKVNKEAMQKLSDEIYQLL